MVGTKGIGLRNNKMGKNRFISYLMVFVHFLNEKQTDFDILSQFFSSYFVKCLFCGASWTKDKRLGSQFFIPRASLTASIIFICFTAYCWIFNCKPTFLVKISSKCSAFFSCFSRAIHIFPTILRFIFNDEYLLLKIRIIKGVFYYV